MNVLDGLVNFGSDIATFNISGLPNACGGIVEGSPRDVSDPGKQAVQVSTSNPYIKGYVDYWNQQQAACETHDESLKKSGKGFQNLTDEEVMQIHSRLKKDSPSLLMKGVFGGLEGLGKVGNLAGDAWGALQTSQGQEYGAKGKFSALEAKNNLNLPFGISNSKETNLLNGEGQIGSWQTPLGQEYGAKGKFSALEAKNNLNLPFGISNSKETNFLNGEGQIGSWQTPLGQEYGAKGKFSALEAKNNLNLPFNIKNSNETSFLSGEGQIGSWQTDQGSQYGVKGESAIYKNKNNLDIMGFNFSNDFKVGSIKGEESIGSQGYNANAKASLLENSSTIKTNDKSGRFLTVNGGLGTASGSSTINSEGFDVGASANLAEISAEVGTKNPDSKTDETFKLGASVGKGIPISGRGYWGDADKDGHREYGFGVDFDVRGVGVSLDIKSEDPLRTALGMAVSPAGYITSKMLGKEILPDVNLTEETINGVGKFAKKAAGCFCF